ncbi:hypothetical protein ACFPES_03130 [Paenibacillus sp. GCM10023248]|uniref:hypothetical protein n=1 Tax=unclassified Paenibacillus TaxID=185978 RepID=UPI002379B7E4|nr:hypothetical protein [Paenibacillus sp. MAHUQ-63]MDD9266018.1 hypothetical protein [Paenibacillus sp. MAHUQ-63]
MNIEQIKGLVMGTEEAAAMWELSQDHVKKLCRLGKCEAFLLGKSWILLRDQPNPKKERRKE